MPIEIIPFGYEESGDQELAGANALAFNVLLDGKGAVRRRPGIVASDNAVSTVIDSAGLEGLYATEGTGELFAVGAAPAALRSIYRVTAAGSFDLTGGQAVQGLGGTTRPVFAESEALLLIAGGENLQKVNLVDGTYASARLGGNPPKATHVVVYNGSAVVNRVVSPLDELEFSEPARGEATAPLETWSGSGAAGQVPVLARSGPVVALYENTNEIWAFKNTITQIFLWNDISTFVPVRSDEVGCAAPYAVVKYDEDFYWIDHKKRIVAGSARGREHVSKPIQATLDDLVVGDAWGFRFNLGQFECLVWQFPTSGIALCYQIGGGWSRWATQLNGNWSPLTINCHAERAGADKEHLVGTTDGKIAKLSTKAFDDLGTFIKSLCRTGYMARGSDTRKSCNGIKLLFDITPSTSSTRIGWIRYRDEDGDWREKMPLEPRGSVVNLRGLGTYRRRQWEIEFEDDTEVSLVSASEEFDILPD